MASGEVVDVELLNGAANHSWASFTTDSNSQEIEFTKLETLRAWYDTIYQEEDIVVRHRDGHPWKLRFPSLNSLDIFCTQDICPLLEYAVLPRRMESICIAMKASAYQELASLVLPAAKRLTLRIDSDPSSDPSMLPAINRILESARGCESLCLTISDRMLQVVPESITCMALTHLNITATTSVDMMLAFIGRLPKLAELSIIYLDLSDTRTDLSVPDTDAGTVVEPLSLSLKSLALTYDSRLHSLDEAVAVVKYMLLRALVLTELIASQVPTTAVLGFVEAYAPRHPRLKSVELILGADEWLEEDV
ncbi:hypothetical protein H4R21_002091 [Coemansia helicoidea]|uniref:Uncharacterized protein n=1 Tax=Coemansia helicoidea TaxID=1286919 RepID=A0ACC1L8V2_9FUNG|nr:hypothetical protein H4R21_002091 [Coemansia helicoidea]